jgi:hypothetical protein
MESVVREAEYPIIRVLLKETGRGPVSEFGSRLVMGYTTYTTRGNLVGFLKVPTLLQTEFQNPPQKIVIMGEEGKMQTVHVSMCRDERVPVMMPNEKGVFRTMDGEITMGRLEQIKLFVHTGLGIYFLCYRAKTEMEILSDYKRLRARELDEQLEQISRRVEKMRAGD